MRLFTKEDSILRFRIIQYTNTTNEGLKFMILFQHICRNINAMLLISISDPINMLFLDKNVESSEVEFEFLVNLALKEKVSWPKLKSFLDDKP